MTSVRKEGDRSRALCEPCGRLVSTRFERRPYVPSEGAAPIPDVLVAVCEECGAIAAIPAQSIPRINANRERDQIRFESRIPRELDDALDWITGRYAGRFDSFRGSLMRYYLGQLSREAGLADRVRQLAESDLARGEQRGRLCFRLDRALLERAWAAAQTVGIEDKADMVRGLVLVAIEDAERPTQAQISVFDALAAASN